MVGHLNIPHPFILNDPILSSDLGVFSLGVNSLMNYILQYARLRSFCSIGHGEGRIRAHWHNQDAVPCLSNDSDQLWAVHLETRVPPHARFSNVENNQEHLAGLATRGQQHRSYSEVEQNSSVWIFDIGLNCQLC